MPCDSFLLDIDFDQRNWIINQWIKSSWNGSETWISVDSTIFGNEIWKSKKSATIEPSEISGVSGNLRKQLKQKSIQMKHLENFQESSCLIGRHLAGNKNWKTRNSTPHLFEPL